MLTNLTDLDYQWKINLILKILIKKWHWLIKVFITHGNIKILNLKSLLQLGMMNLVCLMDDIPFQTIKIILSTL